jgi:hypothetical protein
MATGFHITTHAARRYQERVDRTISMNEARLRLQRLVSLGRVRATPRHWTRNAAAAAPGLRFIYWSGEPNVCALVREDAVVTVLTRTLCRSVRPRHLKLVERPVARSAEEVARWRWNGDLAALDDAV